MGCTRGYCNQATSNNKLDLRYARLFIDAIREHGIHAGQAMQVDRE